MESVPDAFSDYLGRRATHHKTRLEKVSKYKSLNSAQLNEDQRALLADGEKAEGKLEETEFLKEKFKAHRELQAQQLIKDLKIAKEQGKAEARAEFAEDLAQLSSFLNFMSTLYKAGHSRAKSRETYAFFRLLEGFYAGGKAGGEVMQRFLAGEDNSVCENGIKYPELKSQMSEMIETIINKPERSLEPMKSLSQPATSGDHIIEASQEPEKNLNIPKQTYKQALDQKVGKSSISSNQKATPSTKTCESGFLEDRETTETQDFSDQFQIVGAKAKDKANKNLRRKANQKKKQAIKTSHYSI